MRIHPFCSLAIIALTSLFAGWEVAHGTEYVVLESNSPRYEVGSTLASETPITVSGDEIMILCGDDGTLIRVEGPFQGIPQGYPPALSDLRQALAQLVGTPREQLGGMAGVRGPGEESGGDSGVTDSRPSPWLIHAGLTGRQCVIREQEISIWREEPLVATEFEIREVSTGRTATIEWRNSEQRTGWPAALPPRDGEVYLLRRADELRSLASIQLFNLEPGIVENDFAAATWLAARGCVAQARLALPGTDEA